MTEGDVKFVQLTKTRQRIFHTVKLPVAVGGSHLYEDIVGLIRRLKTDKRSAIGKSLPDYTYEVHLEKEPVRKFYDEAEAKAWVRAVLKLE